MEEWEVLLEGFPKVPDIRSYVKALKCAEVTLKRDLAPFEIEWILQTLLHNPVNLLHVVTANCSDDGWSEALADSFKLLADVVINHDEAEKHYEDIVTLCELRLDSTARNSALLCLSTVAAKASIGARQLKKHIISLQQAEACRAPLALCIGTICEHQPEVVGDQVETIWRTFLVLLDSNKKSDKLTCSILKGILGLFKHFGTDLPTGELNAFYDKMVSDYITIPTCEDVIISILSHHHGLFRERVSRDVRTRRLLWRQMEARKRDSVGQALRAVYWTLEGNVQDIITTEVLPRVEHWSTKYAALRVLSDLQSKDVDGRSIVDVHICELEFALRSGSCGYEVADAISWCIESYQPHSDKLLQTAILFYHNIPEARRKEIVVRGILNAHQEFRIAILNFLITESTIDLGTLDQYLPIWRDLFNTTSGQEVNLRPSFEDFMAHVVFVLENFLREGVETLPERLSALLVLTSHVLTLQPPEDYSSDYATVLINLLTSTPPCAAALCAGRAARAHVGPHVAALLHQIINLERCKDEALLCETCLTLLELPMARHDQLFTALQIIFSSNDADPKTLSKAIKRLEDVIGSKNHLASLSMVNNIIEMVDELRSRKDMSGKDARILHRDVVMFLGKYGKRTDSNNNMNADDAILIKLEDAINLSIPNVYEGTTYKLNLIKILRLALHYEDSDALQALLKILCANLSTNNSARELLPKIALCLARAISRGNSLEADLRAALASCDTVCVLNVFNYISEEKSPGVRKILSDALEGLLTDPTCNQELIVSVAEKAFKHLRGSDSTTKRAGLDITQTLTAGLNQNNSLAKRYLPDILLLTAKTYEVDSIETFELASKSFMERIELFDEKSVEDLFKSLIRSLVAKQNGRRDKMAARIYEKTVLMCLVLIKQVCSYKNVVSARVLDLIFDVFVEVDNFCIQSIYVLAKFKEVFELKLSTNVLTRNELLVLNELFCIEIGDDCMETPYVLEFMEQYAVELLELEYQKTQEHLSKTIFNLTPDSVKYIYRNLQSCMSVYHKSLRTTSTILMKSFESWCEKLPLKLITDSIEKELFENEHAVIVGVLKMMLAAVNLTDLSVLTAVKIHARKWPQILLKSFSKGFLEKYLKSKMAYLTDLLAVSVKFSSMTDVKSLILEGVNLHGVANEKIGFKFCKFFMDVFFEFLIRKPFVLLDENMRECYILLSDVTKHAAKRRNTDEELINVLELVDKLWPIYSASTDFNDKYSLLLNLSSLPHKLGPESNPMQWAVNVIASDANREDKARLIVVLPGGESYKSAYRQYASTLPVRLSELNSTSNAALRALLDALAARADVELLHIVFALCTDPTKGWWEAAMDACCASLSQRVDLAALPAVGKIGVIPTTRLLVPLLRYSTPSTCERYFSSTLKDIMAKLNVKYAPSAHVKYKTCLESYTKAFILLKVAFEKVPPQSLESPSSLLYSAMAIDPPQPWWLIRRTCDRCVTLNKLDASDIYKETFRQMQCANYNCLCAAICRRAPVPHFYKHVFSERFWSSIIDQQREYLLPLTSKWEQRTKRHAVSIDVESEESRLSSSRTRVFLRTLSENPLLYDFVDEVDDDVSPQELQLTENELNSHECASTLTALVQHVAAQSKNNWREETSIGTLVETLANALCGGHPNSRFLLAQVICNCKEELKAHASLLRPALLALVADTLRIENGRKLLNGLHLDVIETLLHWPEESPSHSEHLDITVEALIGTCLQRPQSNYLTNTLGRVLDVYSCVNVRWKFDENPADPTKVYQLLIQISKRKIYIPELLPTLLGKLDSKQGMAKLSELFGLAVSCGHTDGQVLVKFRKLLERRREANIGEYLKMLYFAQMGCADCCDEYHFRKITDLVPKMPSAEKPKCLKILKSFVKSHRSEYIKDMYDTVSVSELLIGDHSVEAMGLVEVGLDQINEELKRRVINQIASYCSHSHVRVRKAACAVMVRAFDELYTPSLEPACKRQKTDSTPLIKTIKSRETDNYGYTVLTALSRCVLDKDGDISREARSCVAKRLSQDMDVRFTESFILTVYIPVICKNKCVSLSVCVTALLEMLLSELRADDRFLRVRLREEPLQLRSTRDFTKLRTMSTKYQGTLRGYTTLTGRRPRKVFLQDDNTPDIDVQVPIASVLDTILQFAKKTPAASIALCAQFAKSLPTLCSEFIPELLQTSELAPLVLELAMVFVDNCDLVSYNSTLASLMPTTRGTEAETSVDLLIQEINIRLKGSEQFVLGFHDECDDDWALCEDDAFRIEDLKAVFGKLSNWDLLTNQQKRKVKSDLPPLWAERGTFQACLNDHRGTDTWFDKMAAAYNHQYQDGMRCLRDMDKWPRRYFNISAVIEALEWQASPGDVPKLTNDMQPSDCMAEWAARFMIRSAYVACLSDSETENKAIVLSRSHELQWCERANEMALSNLVLGCVKRNSEDLYESETLPWLRQKVLALRNMGLERQNTELLAKALDTAEMYTPKFIEESCPKDVLLMDKLILLLHRDLQSLSKQKLQSVLKDVETQLTKTQFELQDKKTVESIYEISISHYDDLWENVTETKQEVLKDMIDVLGRAADLDLPRCSAFLDLILNRLEMYPEIMPENVAKKFLDNIQLLLPTLDEFALQELRKHKAMFPSHLLAQFEYMGDRDSDSLTKYTRCLQLINDPEYTLLQYVDLLDRSLKKYDSSEWEKIFSRISYKVFDNPYAGTDYQLLTKYKNKLYEIKDFERTESFKAKAETVIKEIKRELNQRREQNLGVFKLSQLCPTLSHDVGDTSLAKLLGLRGVHVVRFEEQIPVFTDSIRRPAVVTALLSTGRSSRYLHKSGEPLRADQAAQRVLAAAGEVWGADAVVGYHVTPLSDDCGLIEFLEDYERLRTLILQSCDLDSVLAKVSRPSDEELILSSTETSLALHRRLESLVPVNSLRNACRRGNRFTATFASMSMLTWILGLGDRHLNNILYSSTDDTVCCVDWASVLEYTAELPSARVTRCLLCACDVTGLESRLQTLLQSLRDTHKLFLATIKIAFKWMGADFEDKYPHIESILRGTSTSYDVSRQIISHSSIKYKDEYIQLLDDVFQEFPVKRQYTVEEQISIFLRQCTDPRILSVTREGWEPWV